jgi:soluble lytic murein transglycosylase-like protein
MWRNLFLTCIILIGTTAIGGGSQDGIIRLPTPDNRIDYEYYKRLAITVSSEYNIKWRLLYGIWMQESLTYTLDPRIRGDKNKKTNQYRAFGIGQVHLRTAKYHYDKNITEELLLDPEINSRVSAAVFKDYLDKFDGDELYAIAAYNMGPKATMVCYKNHTIPKNYKKYVRKVLGYSWSATDNLKYLTSWERINIVN